VPTPRQRFSLLLADHDKEIEVKNRPHARQSGDRVGTPTWSSATDVNIGQAVEHYRFSKAVKLSKKFEKVCSISCAYYS
jgi:hypothetical protein